MLTLSLSSDEERQERHRQTRRDKIRELAKRGGARVTSNFERAEVSYIDRLKERRGFSSREQALTVIIQEHQTLLLALAERPDILASINTQRQEGPSPSRR